jgi:hypothetical protein
MRDECLRSILYRAAVNYDKVKVVQFGETFMEIESETDANILPLIKIQFELKGYTVEECHVREEDGPVLYKILYVLFVSQDDFANAMQKTPFGPIFFYLLLPPLIHFFQYGVLAQLPAFIKGLHERPRRIQSIPAK